MVVLVVVVLVAFAVVELVVFEAVELVEFVVVFVRLIRPDIAVDTMVPLESEEYCQNITPVYHLLN